ncbi:response regulator transcription factor [Streptomyces sp. UNOB3_S3]|uniref:response regulator transcription factor n=1 Tax=Streptomyces sp. UNOB3_S3 TaxID=2871682 RepID=UPI001E531C37|nr:LuxR C-terminal-related transcriptional regulator [Streptomyces sp. UNOB3_S3]MCC3774257.1 LuxR C-terminal-related transcriptional regulator [Streptomyces sp. UNOB3_S3]
MKASLTGRLRVRDYEQILDLVVAILGSTDPESTWPLITKHLREVFDCAGVTISSLNTAERVLRAEAWAPESHGPIASDFIERYPTPDQHPLTLHVASGGTSPVILSRISERWRHSPWYDLARETGGGEQLGLPTPGDPQALRSLVLRQENEFTDRDLALATRIQPLILTADSQARELRRLHAATPLSVSTVHDLTPRELTVLGLLAEGLTTQGIARRLLISPHTVNRHLEKVYRKLGTNNRVSTVLLAKQHGLVP